MDAGAHIYRFMQEARERHSRGLIDSDGLAALGQRANRLSARIRVLKGRRPNPDEHEREALRQLRTLVSAVDSGGTVVALDVGYDRHCRFDEVGVATWRAGAVETVTLVDETALYRIPDDARRVLRHPLQVYRPSLFGPTLQLPLDEVHDRARRALGDATVAVFHSAQVDLDRLELRFPSERIVDTAQCGQAWYGRRTPALGELCELYGIDATDAHNSGNDARRTLDVAIAMTRDPVLGRLAEQERLRDAREAAKRRMAMLPTRAPGFDDLRLAWATARRADEDHACETARILSGRLGNLPQVANRYRRLGSTRAALSGRSAGKAV